MNAGIGPNDPTIHYYDSDYPSAFTSIYAENFDDTTKYQGLYSDVNRYTEIVSEMGGDVLELFCGTGRVAIPLARNGFNVTGVDLSSGMLQQFTNNLSREEIAVQERIKLVDQDVIQLSLDDKFRVCIIAFNSLLCIPDFEEQCKALQSVSNHLDKDGIMVLDIVNPLQLKVEGDNVPKPFFTRRNVHTGNMYTRFAMVGAFDENHRQELYGWYDEVEADGSVKRQHYSVYWRPIFRFEIELMLERVGLKIVSLEGGHLHEPYTSQSPRMFIQAKKI